MDRRDRDFLNKQSSRNRHEPWRFAGLIIGLVAVFIIGVTAGGLLFGFGGNASTPKNFNDGKTALAFFLNGTANTGQR